MSGVEIYLAGPLFSEGDRMWARTLKEKLQKDPLRAKVIWPYERMTEDQIKRYAEKAPRKIFKKCVSDLEGCNRRGGILVAILDGQGVDDGTAWEIGYFYHLQKMKKKVPRIYGIRTDARRAGESEFSRTNAMLEKACRFLVTVNDKEVTRFHGRSKVEVTTDFLIEKIHRDLARASA